MPNMNVNTNYHTRVRNIVLELQAGSGGGTVKHAETARRLETPRMIKLHGDVTGSAMFDGSGDAYIKTTIGRITDKEIDKIVDYDPSGDTRITEEEIDAIINGEIPNDDSGEQTGQRNVRINERDIDTIVGE